MDQALVNGRASVVANIKPELRPLDMKELLNFEPVGPATDTIREEVQKIETLNLDLIPNCLVLPNWPEVSLGIYLGIKECFLVEPVGQFDLYQLSIDSGSYWIVAHIYWGGGFSFELTKINENKRFLRKPKIVRGDTNEYKSISSAAGHHGKIEQLNALYLFHQFQNEILSEAMEKIRSEVGRHSQSHKEAVKVFEKVTQAFRGSLL